MKSVQIIFLFAAFILYSCDKKSTSHLEKSVDTTTTVSLETIENQFNEGNFALANEMIHQYLLKTEVTASEMYELNWKKDLMHRIALDFKKNEAEITEQLKNYYPHLSAEQMRKWEESRALEMRMIDGERRYYKYAVNNLFRIDSTQKKIKEQVDGISTDGLGTFISTNAPLYIENARKSKSVFHSDKTLKLKYKITIAPNAVPDGEVIRGWLPFPLQIDDYQTNIELLTVNAQNYMVAPESSMQRTIYFEQTAMKDSATIFYMELKINTKAQWFGNQLANAQEYDTQNPIYSEFTAERPPHIVFSDRIKTLSAQIVGDEKNPVEIVRKIYTWIDQNIPWASALEYSTIPCIPEYVLSNRHGDCGQQTLLLITLLRYNNIPTKWQSGWYLIPENINLHDWAEVYYEGIGWVPVDPSFELINSIDNDIKHFYTCGLDPYRFIVNNDYAQPLFPSKIYPRSEPLDFQRGEFEWRGGNLYFNQWEYDMQVEYLK